MISQVAAFLCVVVFGQFDSYKWLYWSRIVIVRGAQSREAGRRLPKPIKRRAEDGGLATINTLIEVRVVNLVVN